MYSRLYNALSSIVSALTVVHGICLAILQALPRPRIEE